MNASGPDPWRERLSEYLDGDLDADERAVLERHLVACAACTSHLSELRALLARVRALPERGPARDLWPSIAAALGARPPRRAPGPWLAFVLGAAAATLIFVLARRPALEGTIDSTDAAAGRAYLLLLHEDERVDAGLSPEQHDAVVQRYTRWAETLGAHCLGGEELAADGLRLAGDGAAEPLEPGARVGGYFLLAARDREEAVALARDCPHLERGGWIELRPVVPHPGTR